MDAIDLMILTVVKFLRPNGPEPKLRQRSAAATEASPREISHVR